MKRSSARASRGAPPPSAARRCAPGEVLIACAVLLVGAGLIEGYVSPDPRFGLPARVAIGVSYWLFMLALLSGRLLRWRRPRAPAALDAARAA